MTDAFVYHSVLRTDDDARALAAVLRLNRAPMAEAGTPLQVTVTVYRRTRKSEQNALYWVVLAQVADQAWIAGRRFDAETWHIHCKREFLPETNERGASKWRLLPNGDRELSMSTSDLNVSEFSTYLNEVQAFAAAELGVRLSQNPRDA